MSSPSDLKTIGLKATLPRLRVLEIFEKSDVRHLTAEDVYKQLLKEGTDTGLATVYRVLTQFEQAGLLIRHHFDILLGAGSDFIPVMLYESRSITARQRAMLAQLQSEYEAPWAPVLEALQAGGRLKADVKLARLLMFGALNWSAQWYDRRKGATLDQLTDAAMKLFIGENE